MDKKRLKKIIIYILLTFTVLIFAALIVPLPVTRIYDAIEIKIDDPSYTVPCRVEIRCFTTGTYLRMICLRAGLR